MSDKTQERLDLEARAKLLEVSFAPNIGDEKLAAKIKKAEDAQKPSNTLPGPPPPNTPQTNESEAKDGASDTPAPSEEEPFLTVRGPRKGIWRAGIQFFDQPQTFAEGDLTQKQIKALENEPKLMVQKRSSGTE